MISLRLFKHEFEEAKSIIEFVIIDNRRDVVLASLDCILGDDNTEHAYDVVGFEYWLLPWGVPTTSGCIKEIQL
jgi:hypothetical protein